MLERSIALWASCPSKAPVWVRKPRLLDAMMSRIAFGPRAGHEGVRTSAAGEVVRKLKTAWGNGPTLLVMSPLKFMRPSAALGPRT